jgi:hypothetical protein
MVPMKQKKEVTSVNGKCQAKNKAGKPCRAHAIRNERYCSCHLNPNHAREIGRKGGQKNRSQNPSGILDELSRIPQNASDIDQMLREAFALTYAGRMSSSQATSLVSIAHALFRGQQVLEHDRRISLIEKQLREKSTADSVSPLSSLDNPDPEEQEAAAKSSKPC